MSQTILLHRLQQTDSQLDQAHASLQKIEALLQDHTLRQTAEKSAQAAKSAWQSAQNKLKSVEHMVAEQRLKIAQTEAALYGGKVRNPKELQGLQKEAASLKKHLSTLEDQQFEAMLALEKAEAVHQAEQESLQATLAQLAERDASLKGEMSELTKTIQRLEIERQAIIAAVPSNELTLYEQLRQQRRGVAVSLVQDKACSTCGTTLTPALIQTIRTSQQIIHCPSCGRILYTA